jgi:transformation/transcription domain-associated protein
MTKLMSIFPTEPSSSNVASKHEELDSLYASAGKIVYEGLSSYDKATPAPPSSLLSAILILKSACNGNPAYLDRLISTFMRVLQRLAKEHLNPVAPGSSAEYNQGRNIKTNYMKIEPG